MTDTDVKKALYKQTPEAKFLFIRKGVAYYTTIISFNDSNHAIRFEIPVDDMGDAGFFPKMDAKLLARWINI